jgi:hypothetical protein
VGAQTAQIRGMVIWQGVKLVAGGMAIAHPVSLAPAHLQRLCCSASHLAIR